jgi:hypothetical protein
MSFENCAKQILNAFSNIPQTIPDRNISGEQFTTSAGTWPDIGWYPVKYYQIWQNLAAEYEGSAFALKQRYCRQHTTMPSLFSPHK